MRPAEPASGVLLRKGEHLRVERGQMIRYRLARAESPFRRWVHERKSYRPRIEHGVFKDRLRRDDRIHRERRERRDLRRERLRERLRLHRRW